MLTQKQHLKKQLREFEAEQREAAANASGLGSSERKKAVDVAAFEKAESSLLPLEEAEQQEDEDLPEKKRQKTSYDPSLRSFWVPSVRIRHRLLHGASHSKIIVSACARRGENEDSEAGQAPKVS